MNLYCVDCRTTLDPPLHSLNYCNECYNKHIVVSHDMLVAQSIRYEQQVIELRIQLDRTRDLMEECRKEAIRCGFRLGTDAKETPQEDNNPSEQPD